MSLLIEVKVVSYGHKGHRNPYLALDDANNIIDAYYQRPYKSNTTHYNTFQALVEVVEHYDGSLSRDRAPILIELKYT